jgi:HD-like signal output (HDOD) protein
MTLTKTPPAAPKALTPAEAQTALGGIALPARPQVLIDLAALLRRDSCDARQVGDLVARDVALAAAMLKTVNSPTFALKSRCASVHQAVQLIGMRNAASIVTALSLRQFAQAGGNQSFERFWDSAEKVAAIAAFVASMLPRVSRDECYTFGLFRDAGLPPLMLRWPEYRETLRIAGGDSRPLPEIEEERHGTNHMVVGYLLAKSWGLPDVLCEAIQRHHDRSLYAPDSGISAQALTLIAVNRLAENVHCTVLTLRPDPEWELIGSEVLEHLGLSRDEDADLREEISSLKF